jgi:hypothetical protein
VTSSNKRPWYKLRWQLTVIAAIAITGSLYLRNHVQKPIEIPITSGPTGQDRSLKERMLFVVNLEKAFRKKGWLASLDLEGKDGKTMVIFWDQLNRPLALQMVQSKQTVADLREMGFKRLAMRNGKQKWDFDLKN